MTPEPTRAYEIVQAALEQPAAERDAFVVGACGDDDELLQEVRRILAEDPPQGFLEPPAPIAQGGLFGGGLEGRTLGEFELLEEIGRGGMGVVYRARQQRLDRLAAVKVLPAVRRDNPAAYERFLREARAASLLSHPGILGVLTSGETGAVAWYAMPFIEGHDLHVEIERQREGLFGRRQSSTLLLTPFDHADYPAAIVQMVIQVAEALDDAHKHGIIHRDVKPRNILINTQGRALLADFGLAKIRDLTTITQSDAIHGTPYYMSPEQARAARREIDERSDVYSLSVVLYESLCLRRPFEGTTQRELLERISSGTHQPLGRANPRLPRDLVLICEKGMAWDPGQRYQTAADLAADLQRFLQHEAIMARPPSLLARCKRLCQQHPTAVTAAGIVLLALLTGWVVSDQLADQRESQSWTQRIGAALELESWDGEESQVADARQAGREARVRGDLPPDLQADLEELSRRLDADADERVAQISGLMRKAQGGYSENGALALPAAPRDILSAIAMAGRALTAHPDDPRIAQLARIESAFPVVRLDWAASPLRTLPDQATSTVVALPLDPLTGLFGPGVSLGPLPVEGFLPPGAWRLIVEVPGQGFAEYDRDLEWSEVPVQIPVHLPARESVVQGLLELPETELHLDAERPMGCCQVLDSVHLSPFWIAEAEVSNGEYLAFLEATGHRPPMLWGLAGYQGDWRQFPGVDGDARWLELPASGMSALDMRDFAEWTGARLPTHYELEYALRGTQMLRDLPPGTLANDAGPDEGQPVEDWPARYALYVANTLPVRAEGLRHPPHGLFHAFGNVAEMTSSKLVEVADGRLQVERTKQLVMGGAWDAQLDGDHLYEHAHAGIGDTFVSLRHGFRCARSAAAP